MNWRICLIFVFVLVFGFILGLGIKWGYETSTFKPYEWNSPPIIANCYGPEFSELQMIRAIDFWTVRGHQIGFYEHNPPDSICKSKELIWGFIVIRKAKPFDLSANTLASTKRMTSGFVVKSAEIKYRPGTFNLDLINEHELGHALGYAHVELEGHIMHPLYDKMSAKFWVP